MASRLISRFVPNVSRRAEASPNCSPCRKSFRRSQKKVLHGRARSSRRSMMTWSKWNRLRLSLVSSSLTPGDTLSLRSRTSIVALSSSMVYESASVFPTPEGTQLACPPPQSSYGFQKLSCEYFARAAWEQYGLPYTIVRPFNCVGVGEGRALNAPTILSGNVKLAMSLVLPDLVLKVLSGQDPLHLLGSGQQVRHYTYGGDVARGIRMAIESDRAANEDFNISTAKSTTVLELAQMVWNKAGPGTPFRYETDPAFPYDVQVRMPDVRKARNILGFEATTELDRVLDHLIPWIPRQLEQGRM